MKTVAVVELKGQAVEVEVVVPGIWEAETLPEAEEGALPETLVQMRSWQPVLLSMALKYRKEAAD